MSHTEAATDSVLQSIREQYEGKLVTGSRSAAGNWLQLTLEKIESGEAIISLEVRPEMTNPYGMIHGGMMALVMDEAIGWAILSLDADAHYTSINLNVDFLYAIKEGERLRARSSIVRHGKKIIHAEVFVYDLQGRVLGKGSSNLVVTGMKLIS